MVRMPFTPTTALAERVAAVMGRQPVEWAEVAGSGYTSARRLITRFADGSSAFVKLATTTDTARWIGEERRVYEALPGARFLPAYYGAGEDGSEAAYPFLALEDLSGACWPPPWTPGRVQAVLDALEQVHSYAGPLLADVPLVEVTIAEDPGWAEVVTDPEPFLSLGLCSRRWLEAGIPVLTAAANAAPFAGDALLHLDTRSDNLCFHPDGHAVLVDWNWACRGNPNVDIAGWAPSLCAEGGPLPEAVLPNAPGLAAWFSGFWAAKAGLPPHPDAPRVREVQRRQLTVALPWAARALDLAPIH